MENYKKDLGLKESVSIVISRIIGSGIFRTPAPIMALVGCTSLFGLVWVIGGIITIFGAVIYAELSAMLPKSGGPYVFKRSIWSICGIHPWMGNVFRIRDGIYSGCFTSFHKNMLMQYG